MSEQSKLQERGAFEGLKAVASVHPDELTHALWDDYITILKPEETAIAAVQQLVDGLKAYKEQNLQQVDKDEIEEHQAKIKAYQRENIVEFQKHIDELLAGMTDLPSEKQLERVQGLIEDIAVIGHIANSASPAARDNTFEYYRRDKELNVPGGIGAYVAKREETEDDLTISDLVESLNRPTTEVIGTAHPTNVNSKDFIEKLHEYTDKVLDYRAAILGNRADDDFESVKSKTHLQAASITLSDTPILPDENLKPAEETAMMLYYMQNVRDNIPGIYSHFDRDLGAFAKNSGKGEEYDPTSLHLDLRFGSWGSSGDKDGNANINYETTLESMLLHRKAGLQATVDQLKEIDFSQVTVSEETVTKLAGDHTNKAGTALQRLAVQQEIIEHDLEVVNVALAEFQLQKRAAEIEGNGRLDAVQLDKVEAILYDEYDGLQIRDVRSEEVFVEAVTAAYKDTEDKALLDLKRQAATFGLTMGHVEYRETAEEYATVVDFLLQQYTEKTGNTLVADALIDAGKFDEVQSVVQNYADLLLPEDRRYSAELAYHGTLAHEDLTYASIAPTMKDDKQISEADRQILSEARETVLNYLLDQPKLAAELYENAREAVNEGATLAYSDGDAAIAFATMRRMEIARDNPDMYKSHVLAECQDPTDLLEAVLLQHAVEKDGNRPALNMVPLFESPEVMLVVGEFAERTYANDHYRSHMQEVANKLGSDEVSQQYQLAHSDNTRRSGIPAARSLIYQAHDILREVGDQNGIHTEFFEGGGISDPYRGGVRALTAMQNEYGTHDFSKFTFQGGDLLNYFNHDKTIERWAIRSTVHPARVLDARDKDLYGDLDYQESRKPYMRAMQEVRKRDGIDTTVTPDGSLNEAAKACVEEAAKIFCKQAGKTFTFDEHGAVTDFKEGFHVPPGLEGGTDKANQFERVRKREVAPFMDMIANEAFVSSLGYYQQEFFNNEQLGTVLAQVFDYEGVKKGGTNGSRAIKRSGGGTAKAEDTYYMDATSTRTISLSETMQHGGLVPTNIGAGVVEDALKEAFVVALETIVDDLNTGKTRSTDVFAGLADPAERQEATEALGAALRVILPGKTVGALDLNFEEATSEEKAKEVFFEAAMPTLMGRLYDTSAIGREVLDRFAYGVAMSDFEQIWKNATGKEFLDPGGTPIEGSIIDEMPETSDIYRKAAAEQEINGRRLAGDEAAKGSVEGFLCWMEREHLEGGKLANMAMEASRKLVDTGKINGKGAELGDRDKVLEAVLDKIPYKDELLDKRLYLKYMNAADETVKQWIEETLEQNGNVPLTGAAAEARNKVLAAGHVVNDTALYSRYSADDPPYFGLIREDGRQVEYDRGR